MPKNNGEPVSFIQSLIRFFTGEPTSSGSGVKVSQYTIDDSEEVTETPESEKIPVADTLTSNELGNDLITDIRPGPVHIHGVIQQLSGRYTRNGLFVTDGILTDATGSVRLVWFNQPYLAAAIKGDVVYEVRGNYKLSRQRFCITNPHLRPLEEGCGPFENEKTKAQQIEEVETAKARSNIWTLPIGGKGLSPDSKWLERKNKVLERDNYTCVVCRATTNLTVDHKLALSLGGTNAMSNLQTLCKDCHEDKHYRNFLDRKFDAMDDYGKNYEPTIKIKALSRALKNGEGVAISYTDRIGVRSRRVIHPKDIYKGYRYRGKIVNKNKVYVNAFDDLDQDGRVFRVSRMTLRNAGTRPNYYIDKPKHRPVHLD